MDFSKPTGLACAQVIHGSPGLAAQLFLEPGNLIDVPPHSLMFDVF
jgi:hypothetical protein